MEWSGRRRYGPLAGHLHREMKRLGVEIYDRIMVTSLLTEDGGQGGRVVGATGFNVRTGEFYIFKSKASILSTAGATIGVSRLWLFAPELVGSGAMGEMNNACVGQAIGWNAGAEFLIMEQTPSPISGLGYAPYSMGNSSNCSPCLSDETLNLGIRLLGGIRESEAEMTYAGNPHELGRLLECFALISVGELVMHSSLARKASSALLSFQRLDYPEVDPPEWQKFLPIRLEDMASNPPTPNRALEFDSDICNGCNRCVEACRNDVMMPNPEKEKPPIVLYPDECWYCGCCVEECPRTGAITLVHPMGQGIAISWKRKETGEIFRPGIKNPPPPNTRPPSG